MTTNNSINTAGQIVQFASATSTSTVSCSTAIPYDNTIPTSSEGTSVITLAITPTKSTNLLVIEFSTMFTCRLAATTSNTMSSALFQDAGSSALAAVAVRPRIAFTDNGGASMNLIYSQIAGTTSSTTFKIRMGPPAGTAFVNANAAGIRLMGGVAESVLTITEYFQS